MSHKLSANQSRLYRYINTPVINYLVHPWPACCAPTSSYRIESIFTRDALQGKYKTTCKYKNLNKDICVYVGTLFGLTLDWIASFLKTKSCCVERLQLIVSGQYFIIYPKVGYLSSRWVALFFGGLGNKESKRILCASGPRNAEFYINYNRLEFAYTSK